MYILFNLWFYLGGQITYVASYDTMEVCQASKILHETRLPAAKWFCVPVQVEKT